MRLWFAQGSEVPIYRQLATQVTLAILSGELKPGERLPSTRELARRFAVHPNTISAGYKLLEREGWTERRRGSGVYVRRQVEARHTPEQILDRHIAGFFRAVRELKISEATVRARVAEWLAAPRPDHFTVIDPDPQMREILLAEIAAATSFRAVGVGMEECGSAEVLAGAVPLCRPSKTKMVRAALPAGVELITLRIRSANAWLAPWLPVADGALIGVVSHWPEFLEVARTMLAAAGVATEALVVRDATRPGWKKGLEQTAAVLCDAYTAGRGELPKRPMHVVFSLIADESLEQLAKYEL
jgi:DNA-binding transcriptional regulator YhcF (GntR family)